MGMMYPWATKEYLLWEMSIGQLIMYHNLGLGIKYPDPNKPKGLQSMPKSERDKAIAEAREMAKEMKEDPKEIYRQKYGAID